MEAGRVPLLIPLEFEFFQSTDIYDVLMECDEVWAAISSCLQVSDIEQLRLVADRSVYACDGDDGGFAEACDGLQEQGRVGIIAVPTYLRMTFELFVVNGVAYVLCRGTQGEPMGILYAG